MPTPQTASRKRQPKGIPTGGEFASNSHDEASRALPKPQRERKVNLSGEEILSEARKATAAYSRRMGLTLDERETALSETLIDSVDSMNKKGKIDGALVNHISKMVVIRQIGHRTGNYTGSNSAAWKMYLARVEKAEGSDGSRVVTDRERDEIADDIIDNWHDPKHKPTQGFHRPTELVSISGIDEDDIDPALIDPFTPEAILERQVPRSDRALESIEMASSVKERNAIKRDLRTRAWEIVSADRDLPPVRAKLSDASRKTIAAIVNKSGGAAAVADRYERGLNDSDTNALFMPFRERVEVGGRVGWRRLTDAQMDSIADMLRSNPRVADELWTSALISAK